MLRDKQRVRRREPLSSAHSTAFYCSFKWEFRTDSDGQLKHERSLAMGFEALRVSDPRGDKAGDEVLPPT